METMVHDATRAAPLLLAALLATTADASIPMDTTVHAVVPAAVAPTLVRLETSKLVKSNPLAAAMNTCVAGIVARDLDGASVYCDKAVTIAAIERSAASTSVAGMTSRRSTTRMLAAAVSNRAVLKWMKSDPAYAVDLQRAQALAPDLDFVQANSAVIGDAPKTAASVVAR